MTNFPFLQKQTSSRCGTETELEFSALESTAWSCNRKSIIQFTKKNKPTNPIRATSPFTRFLLYHDLAAFLFPFCWAFNCSFRSHRNPSNLRSEKDDAWERSEFESRLGLNLGEWLGESCRLLEVGELDRAWNEPDLALLSSARSETPTSPSSCGSCSFVLPADSRAVSERVVGIEAMVYQARKFCFLFKALKFGDWGAKFNVGIATNGTVGLRDCLKAV